MRTSAAPGLHWLDNPLLAWRIIKDKCILRGEPVRVKLLFEWNGNYQKGKPLLSNRIAHYEEGAHGYAGYLYRMDGNNFVVRKFGNADKRFTYPQLLGLVLSGRMYPDNWHKHVMPEYYVQFFSELPAKIYKLLQTSSAKSSLKVAEYDTSSFTTPPLMRAHRFFS